MNDKLKDNSKVLSPHKGGREYRGGILAILGCQFLWGSLPIYWQSLRPINSWVIILYRIVLVFVYAYLAAGFRYGFRELLAPLKDRATRRRYMLAGIFITANWSTYIWAVNANYVVQTAIGYFIEPLVICAIGVVVFKERLTKYNFIAILLAVVAVSIILLYYGQLPWIGLTLALTFAVYSAIKKTVKQPAVVSMVYETIWFVAPALIAIIYLESKGIGAIAAATTGKYALLYLCGLFTLVPMALFAHAAPRVPLHIIGLFQYISPTISLVCAATLFGEEVERVQLIAFIIIWIGLIIFSYGELRGVKTRDENQAKQ